MIRPYVGQTANRAQSGPCLSSAVLLFLLGVDPSLDVGSSPAQQSWA